MDIIIIALAVLLLSALVTARFARPDAPIQLIDQPNERSLHSRPISRTGGIAICGSVGLGLSVLYSQYAVPAFVFAICVGAVAVMLVSLLDDRAHVSPVLRLAGHMVGAGIVMAGGVIPSELGYPGGVWLWQPWIAFLIIGPLIIWMINLYNFMDGMDGFAGGMTVIGFGSMSLLGWGAGAAAFAGSSLIVAAAAAGFLVRNFPPARIFMGDSGSATLGFLMAALSLWGVNAGIFQFWVPLLIFSPFIVDATVTLIRRAVQGEKIWVAHRSHYYQRLVQMGWGHRRTVLWEYALMLLCALSACIAHMTSSRIQWAILFFWAMVYLGIAVMVRAMERRRQGAVET